MVIVDIYSYGSLRILLLGLTPFPERKHSNMLMD